MAEDDVGAVHRDHGFPQAHQPERRPEGGPEANPDPESGGFTFGNDVDVQRLTFEAYMNKRIVRAKPMAHLRIMAKNIAHLTGLVRAEMT